MLLSWNASDFPLGDYYSYTFWNQSTIYINASAPEPNWLCNTSFKADPDIAGIGVSIREIEVDSSNAKLIDKGDYRFCRNCMVHMRYRRYRADLSLLRADLVIPPTPKL